MYFSNLILQNSYLILLSVGMFFCILTGNVDLSVGSVLAFCGSILGVLIVKCGLNPWLSTILVLALGVTIGVIQGVFIAYLNVPPFIVTLAGELMFRGLTLVILAGHSISPFPADFQYIALKILPSVRIPNRSVMTVNAITMPYCRMLPDKYCRNCFILPLLSPHY